MTFAMDSTADCAFREHENQCRKREWKHIQKNASWQIRPRCGGDKLFGHVICRYLKFQEMRSLAFGR